MSELLAPGPHFEKEPACSVTIRVQLLLLLSKELRSLFYSGTHVSMGWERPLWGSKQDEWAGQLRGSLLRESSACQGARVPHQEATLGGWICGTE